MEKVVFTSMDRLELEALVIQCVKAVVKHHVPSKDEIIKAIESSKQGQIVEVETTSSK